VNRSTSRSVLAGLVVAGGLALSACASGQVAQTAQMSPTVDGQMAQVGSLAIRNVALDYPAGGVYERGVRVASDTDERRRVRAVRLARQRPARDRDHAHRVVVARAHRRCTAMTG